MTPQISLQLYSVRTLAEANFESTIREIAKIGFTCVEPAGYPSFSAEKASKLFAELDLKAPSAHLPLPIGDQKNAVIEEALMMGHQYIITGCPPKFRDDFATLDSIRRVADLYCEAAENAAQHGLKVGYHNHDWDVLDIEGEPSYRIFLQNTPDTVLWEADVFWVACGGRDPVAFLKEIGTRGRVLHFKDGAVNVAEGGYVTDTDNGEVIADEKSPFLPAGRGDIDLIAMAKAATSAEVIVVELDEYNGEMMDAVAESYRYLTANGIAKGTK